MNKTRMIYGNRELLDNALTELIKEVNCITPVGVILNDQTLALFTPSFIFFDKSDVVTTLTKESTPYLTDRWIIFPNLNDSDLLVFILVLAFKCDTIQLKVEEEWKY